MIELCTPGALEAISADGTPLRSVLVQPRRTALLSYLALASPRAFHRRDTLFALFWPEHDTEQARHALRAGSSCWATRSPPCAGWKD